MNLNAYADIVPNKFRRREITSEFNNAIEDEFTASMSGTSTEVEVAHTSKG